MTWKRRPSIVCLCDRYWFQIFYFISFGLPILVVEIFEKMQGTCSTVYLVNYYSFTLKNAIPVYVVQIF